jgi:hypothetical protein
MSIVSNLDKLKVINSEIKNKKTGNPDDFAEKLNISRSMLYVYIEEIKTLGAEIKYNRSTKTFYYKNDFDITINICFDNKDTSKLQ